MGAASAARRGGDKVHRSSWHCYRDSHNLRDLFCETCIGPASSMSELFHSQPSAGMLGCGADMIRLAGSFVSNTSAAHHSIQDHTLVWLSVRALQATFWLSLPRDCSTAHDHGNTHREIKFPVTLSAVHTIVCARSFHSQLEACNNEYLVLSNEFMFERLSMKRSSHNGRRCLRTGKRVSQPSCPGLCIPMARPAAKPARRTLSQIRLTACMVDTEQIATSYVSGV